MLESNLPDVYTLVGLLEEYTMEEVGAMYGVTRQRVSQYLKRHGVSAPSRIRSRARKKGTIQAVIALAQQGMSLSGIGRRVRLNPGTVKRILQRNKVEYRTYGTEKWGCLTEGINFKVTPELKQAICQRADEYNITVSDMIRQLLTYEFLFADQNSIEQEDEQEPSQG